MLYICIYTYIYIYYIYIYKYIYIYIQKFNNSCYSVRLPHPWSRENHGQEMFLAPSTDH